MNTFHLAGIVLFVMLGISLSGSSPLDRLKRSLDDEGEDPGCSIPGMWSTCKGKRDMKTVSDPQVEAAAQPGKLSSSSAGGCNIPGIWNCLGVTKMAADDTDSSSQLRGATTEGNVNNYDDDQSEEDPDKCPLGSLTCRRKRMLKKMLKQAKRVERSAKKCPPGIWVC